MFLRRIAVGRGWRIVLVDQRNHGRSADLAGFDRPHTMAAAAQDLTNLVNERFEGQQVAVIAGHSLGGKTVLEYVKQTATQSDKTRMPQQVYIMYSHTVRQLVPLSCVGLVMRISVSSSSVEVVCQLVNIWTYYLPPL